MYCKQGLYHAKVPLTFHSVKAEYIYNYYELLIQVMHNAIHAHTMCEGFCHSYKYPEHSNAILCIFSCGFCLILAIKRCLLPKILSFPTWFLPNQNVHNYCLPPLLEQGSPYRLPAGQLVVGTMLCMLSVSKQPVRADSMLDTGFSSSVHLYSYER